MPRSNDHPATPQDDHERKRIAELRPAAWTNPEPERRYPLVVVGAGFAGLAGAELAAARGIKVALVERDFLGGTCVNTGCVPSKTIIRTSRLYAEMRDAERYGARVPTGIQVDFAAAMERVRRIRAHLGRSSSVRHLAAAGIDVFFGDARFTGPDGLSVGGTTLPTEASLPAERAKAQATHDFVMFAVVSAGSVVPVMPAL